MIQKILSLKDKYWLQGLGAGEYYNGNGAFYTAPGIDVLRTPGRLQTGYPATIIATSIITDNIQWMTFKPGGTYAYGYGNTGKMYQIATADDMVTLIDTNSASQGQGLELYNNTLVYSQNTQVGSYNWSTFTDTAISKSTPMTTSAYHPMKVGADNNLYIGNIEKLAKWDGTTFTLNKLTFDTNLTITALGSDGFYLTIGAVTSPATGNTKRLAYIYFWDMVSSQVSRAYPLPDADNVNYISYKDGWTYVWCDNVAYRCQYDSPPTEFLRKSGMYFGRRYGRVADTYKNSLIWSDNSGKIGMYGTTDYGMPSVLQNPFQVSVSANNGITSIMTHPPSTKIYIGTDENKLFKIFYAGSSTNLTATTPYIDLGRYWKLHYMRVITEPLASGDSLVFSLKSYTAGSELLSATGFSYSADGAIEAKNLPIDGKIVDKLKFAITFYAGAPVVKSIELFGEPMSELYTK